MTATIKSDNSDREEEILTAVGFSLEEVFPSYKKPSAILVSSIREAFRHPNFLTHSLKHWPTLIIGHHIEGDPVQTADGTVKLYSGGTYKLENVSDARAVDFIPPEGKGIILIVNHPANTYRDYDQFLGRAGRHGTPAMRFAVKPIIDEVKNAQYITSLTSYKKEDMKEETKKHSEDRSQWYRQKVIRDQLLKAKRTLSRQLTKDRKRDQKLMSKAGDGDDLSHISSDHQP